MNPPLRCIHRLIFVALALVIAGGLAGCGSGGSPNTPPAATVTALSPVTMPAGSAAFNVTVTGSNFVSGAIVKFNSADRFTTFVSATQLIANIPPSDVASVGTVPVTVANPLGAPLSNAVSFTISTPVTPVNPGPPILTNLAPTSAIAGSGSFTLVVNGSNFVSGAVVNFNGIARTTTFVTAAQVTAAILATDVATIGTAPITVTNPSGGGSSNPLTFTAVSPGTPIATTLAPASVLVGAAFALTVTGSNFANGAVVNVNGTPRSTTFVSATQLTAAILATDVASGGTASITVTNPAGAGTSTALTLTIVDPRSPTVTALTPVSTMVGSGAFTLTVTGSNFVSGAVVNFNGTLRTTTFVASNQLTASILAADLASVGTANVSVTNVSAGATSNTLPFTISATAAYTGPAFTGTVSAGSQAVSGSIVKLFAAGIAGNGSTATPLLVAALTTDTTGSFSVPAGYTCPSPTSQLYVVARGGQLGTANANSTIAFVTSLGACNQIIAASHVVLNEVTTVATVWAFSQFLAPGGNIGASATNTVGIANAAATAASLANPKTGAAPGATFPSNGAAPTAKINTLANLLNTCTSQSSSSTACSNLLSSATGPALQNQDMLDATLRIIHNPAANVAALFTQSVANTAFKPALTIAPSDWTLYVTFTGGGMNYPAGIGVDANGNVWVGSYFHAGSTDQLAGSAAELSPIGQQLFPSGISGYGLSNIYGLAVDASNNAWITNEASPGSVNGGLGSVTVLDPSGQPLSGATGYTDGGIDFPIAVAIDTDTTAWVIDYGNAHLTHLSSSGTALSGASGYTSGHFSFPVALAIDATHNVWVANQSGVSVTKVSPDGKTFTDFPCCYGPSGLAVDQQGNVWVANFYSNGDTQNSGSISQVSSSGKVVTFTANNTFNSPQATAIDGNGNVWIGNFHASYLTELAGASSASPGQTISPAAGWAPDANLFGAYAIAIDASGNLWVSNLHGLSVTEFIGMAAPVKTPLLGPPQTP